MNRLGGLEAARDDRLGEPRAQCNRLGGLEAARDDRLGEPRAQCNRLGGLEAARDDRLGEPRAQWKWSQGLSTVWGISKMKSFCNWKDQKTQFPPENFSFLKIEFLNYRK
jgi:hypothetical protein